MAILLFLSALLLFLVQPILGKALLPDWGGGANVWTACLMFFQLGLLLGYGYAFASVRWLTTRSQLILHGVLVGASLLWMPLRGSSHSAWMQRFEAWGWDPAWQILMILALSIGLPYVLISSTSPLLSHWRLLHARDAAPYRWYSLSSLGSLLGCLLYPFAIEPWIGLRTQETLWTIGYLAVCVGLAIHVWGFLRSERFRANGDTLVLSAATNSSPDNTLTSASSPWLFMMWVGLSTCSSIVLSASTSAASQAGIIVPGVWVLPLAMYLVSWWFAFRSPRWERWSAHMLLFFAGGFLALALLIFKLWLPWVAMVLGYVAVVGLVSLACHNLLYVIRPAPERLTSFYLAIALGGALGGAFVALLAPALFDDFWELHLGLILGAGLMAAYYSSQMLPKLSHDPWVRRIYWPATLLAALLLIGALWMHTQIQSLDRVVERQRDFYGLVSVVEPAKSDVRSMLHGQTQHGAEPLDGNLHPDRTMYYQANSGAALAWGWCHSQVEGPLRVGILGLGTGSLSLFANRSDRVVYYELSPAVVAMAKQHFHYLSSHSGETEIRMGDGRRLLADEAADPQAPPFDLLLIDAFSNDSLPMHLLTVEALDLYARRLTSRGLIAMNITNRNLDLAPVLMAAAKRCHRQSLLVESPMESPENASTRGRDASKTARTVRWLLLFPEDVPLPTWPNARTNVSNPNPSTPIAPWTDDFGSPLHALRWSR